MKLQDISRRDFIRQAAWSGAALTLAAYMPANGKAVAEIVNPVTNGIASGTELMSWISIGPAGKVTLMCNRSEMGQGTFQALPQMLAEELEVSLDDVHIIFAPANPAKYGPQPQEGSFSVRGWAPQLLRTGASAREMLIEAAASEWKVPKSECYAENGEVIHRVSGRRAAYSALVEKAAKLEPPADVQLKKRADYKIIGKPVPRKDIPLKTNGSAIFGLDKKLPGMKYAVVERSKRFRETVKSFDDSETRKVPGVTHVFKVQRPVFSQFCEGVAVVADSLWAAMQGRKLLKVDWADFGSEHPSTASLEKQMRENLQKIAHQPKFDGEYAQCVQKLEASYETPYQSHSCMEPLNCIADVRPDSIEIWGPIQEANWIQADLSQRFNIPTEQVTVNMTFLGGGFGRKGFTDYPFEAAFISKEIQAPVQVVWTREDDMTAGPFRPGAFYTLKGGLDAKGHIHAFQAITATQWIGQEWSPKPPSAPDAPGYNSSDFEGLLHPYRKGIPHYSFGGAGTHSPIPVMWWRSVYASTNGFACESFIDEMAHLAGKDPLQFRRDHLPDTRYQALVDKMAELTNWSSRSSKQGWGVAFTECFTGICGHAVKVMRNAEGKVRIEKVIALMDCGWYVNPDTIRAQVEGSIVMALGAATTHATTFGDGKAVQQNFDSYPMPRITDIPPIEVHIMENDEKPGGVGEPGLPPFAPALANAIFDLTGQRVRRLPFSLDEISQ
ncbi:molybdopterin-dependent oxidoreductase [Dyadobacter sp. CY261]|uniref:xanthine dehydrogenase family protein molybdopterin-binding subunit n=1 Tax=Dyadobacter sp. CY261 TaxID=2907203 RepID=UPI001F21C474|nr:molybdopterin cofactor-binding domain-containing protein [Dyadobacter sp. CY261]MCF0071234.1 molybdopterin-dependent oxidoreductase [Dyadobacter sp. CY261]